MAQHFGDLDILVTLRCNASCKNCIEMCNSCEWTGLNYDNMDMSAEQIHLFCRESKTIWEKQKPLPLWGRVVITGGEPLLHPDVIKISRILRAKLIEEYPVAESLLLNTNMTLPIPSGLACPTINYLSIEHKPKMHNAVLMHPDDMGCKRPAYVKCQHYRKRTRVLSKHGFSTCCAGDGYIRLFGLGSLIHDHLPSSIEDWHPENMDTICQHCPFGCTKEVLERDVGAPVSKLYMEQIKANKAGRIISKTYRMP